MIPTSYVVKRAHFGEYKAEPDDAGDAYVSTTFGQSYLVSVKPGDFFSDITRRARGLYGDQFINNVDHITLKPGYTQKDYSDSHSARIIKD